MKQEAKHIDLANLGESEMSEVVECGCKNPNTS
jgi:hypothetical protein